MKPQLVTFETVEFKVDSASRVIAGKLLPFGETSRPARDPQTGMVARFHFADASKVALPEPSEVVLNYGHDRDSLESQLGVATKLEARDDGVYAEFRIAKTPEGDRVLALAADDIRVLRKFSAEVAGAFEPDEAGVQHAVATAINGAAVVIRPAFTGADITHVAASAALTQEETMQCDKCGKVHAAGVTACEAPASVAFSVAEAAELTAKVEAQAQRIAQLESIKIPVGPGGATGAQLAVVEEPIYRFAGAERAPSGFDFAEDLLKAARNGDEAALKRVQDFTAAHLAPDFVTTSDVSPTNNATYRPDMFLGQAPIPPSPLYDTFYKGTLGSVQPFFWSKFDRVNSNAGVSDHTEGVEPAPKTVKTLVGTTVTPSAVSGKVHITREVADMGGNPQVSAMVWAEFERSFKIALETKTAALVKAAMASFAPLATIAAGTTGAAADDTVLAGLIDLQFDPEGFRFTRGMGAKDLYKLLALAKTTDGDPLHPILGATNRTGDAADKFAHINVGGYDLFPTASLNVTGAAGTKENSLVADPGAVHVWNSGLQRLDKLQEDVEGWDLGCFAYFAGVIYDPTGVRRIETTR